MVSNLNKKEELSNKDKEKKIENENNVLPALLDFFSDSGLGYVSAFVASIFGLFAIITLLEDQSGIGFCFLSVSYFVLSLGGAYALLNYAYNIRIANQIKRKIVENTCYAGKFETTFEIQYRKDMKERNIWTQKMWGLFFYIKNRNVMRLAIVGYLIVVLVPWLVIFLTRFEELCPLF